MKVRDLIKELLQEDQDMEITKSHFSSSHLGGEIADRIIDIRTEYVRYSTSESSDKIIDADDISAEDVTREVLVI